MLLHLHELFARMSLELVNKWLIFHPTDPWQHVPSHVVLSYIRYVGPHVVRGSCPLPPTTSFQELRHAERSQVSKRNSGLRISQNARWLSKPGYSNTRCNRGGSPKVQYTALDFLRFRSRYNMSSNLFSLQGSGVSKLQTRRHHCMDCYCG